MNDADLLTRWMTELTKPAPNVVIVASLEAEADTRGWSPLNAYRAAMTAAPGMFDPDLHPRGRDGKFIEKLGLVELFDLPETEPGQRGKVTDITPDPRTPGRPDVHVDLVGPDGTPGKTLTVKPSNIAAAPEKARIDTPDAPVTFEDRVAQWREKLTVTHHPKAKFQDPALDEATKQMVGYKADEYARAHPEMVGTQAWNMNDDDLDQELASLPRGPSPRRGELEYERKKRDANIMRQASNEANKAEQEARYARDAAARLARQKGR